MNQVKDRYQLLLERSSDLVVEFSRDGMVIWASPSSLRLSGWTPDELTGRAIDDLVMADDQAGMALAVDRLMRGEEVAFEGRVRTAGGGQRWVSVTAAPLFDDAGEVTGGVADLRDIQDAVEARQALAASEEHYRMLADHVADVVLQLTPDLEILWASPSVRDVLGWQPEQLIGLRIDDVVHPDDLARVQARRFELSDPDHADGPVPAAFIRVRRADGSYCWISSRPTRVHDAGGRANTIVSAWTDVSELVKAREGARDAAVRLRTTLDTLFDPHIVVQAVRDEHETIVDFAHVEINDAACRFYGMRRDDILRSRLLDNVSERSRESALAMIAHVIETGVPLVLDDYCFVGGDETDDPRRFDVRAVKVGEDVSCTWRDVTDRHHFEQHLSHLATHDPLTGLANRAALVDDLTRAITSSRRSDRPVGVIMFDLDHFKTVNDTAGHPIGDQLLRAAARRLVATVRGGDLVARPGGDEFVVVMRELVEPAEAFQAGTRIVEEFRHPLIAGGLEFVTTASVGIVIATPQSTTEDLLREADAAMYRAKDDGRDRASIFNEDLRVAAAERSEMEGQLRPALSLGELAVYYQPEIDLATGRVCGVEALLRWNHPSGELYPASRFIDLAEEIGVIVDSGNWAVHQACLEAARWAKEHTAERIRLRLNLSKQQLAEPSLVASVDDALARSNLDPTLLCVEIREDVLLRSASIAHTNLADLNRRGIGLTIDNFGTGYAALAYLRDHEVDTVKIDRSFIHDLSTNAYSRRLVAGLAAFAQRLDLRVSAEGVETQEQIEILTELGCASAQGFVFCAPVPPDALGVLLDHTFSRAAD